MCVRDVNNLTKTIVEKTVKPLLDAKTDGEKLLPKKLRKESANERFSKA